MLSIEQAKEKSCAYNKIRELCHGKEMSFAEMTQVFKSNNFGFGHSYVLPFINNGLLYRAKCGRYTFPTEPVHYNDIIKAFDQLGNQSKKKNPVEKKSDTKVTTTMEEDCIAYLKGLGYKIMKPTITYNEV